MRVGKKGIFLILSVLIGVLWMMSWAGASIIFQEDFEYGLVTQDGFSMENAQVIKSQEAYRGKGVLVLDRGGSVEILLTSPDASDLYFEYAVKKMTDEGLLSIRISTDGRDYTEVDRVSISSDWSYRSIPLPDHFSHAQQIRIQALGLELADSRVMLDAIRVKSLNGMSFTMPLFFAGPPDMVPGDEFIIDNADTDFSTDPAWVISTSSTGYYGIDYARDTKRNASNTEWARWDILVNTEGIYEIHMRWPADSSHPDSAPLEIQSLEGIDLNKTVNQTINGGGWNYIGDYSFSTDALGYLKIKSDDRGFTVADAIKLVYKVQPAPTPTITPSLSPSPSPLIPGDEFIIDNLDPNFQSDTHWTVATEVAGYHALNYAHDNNSGPDPNKWSKWLIDVWTDGLYDVYMIWPSKSQFPDSVPVEILSQEGVNTGMVVNQKKKGGVWNYLGEFTFSQNSTGYVKIIASDQGTTVADAIKLVYKLQPLPTPTPTITPTPTPTPNPNTNLLVHYPLNESFGAIANDLIASNHGTLTNFEAEKWESGVVGGALRFDGLDDWLNIENGSFLQEAFTQRSISLWMNTGTIFGNQSLFELGDDVNGMAIRLSDNQLEGAVVDNGIKHTVTTTVGMDEWYHAVLVYDGVADQLQWYLDHFLVDQVVGVGFPLGEVSAQTDLPAIGAVSGNHVFQDPVGTFYHGVLDDIRVYDKALSQAEVDLLFDLGIIPPKPTPTPTPTVIPSPTAIPDVNAYYKLDELFGLQATNNLGVNHGVLMNYVSPSWTTGLVDGGLGFDGINQWVDLENGDFLERAFTQRTFAVWFQLENIIGVKNILEEGGISGMALRVDGNQLEGAVRSEGVRHVVTHPVLANAWTHGVLIFDGTNGTLSLYVNNLLVDQRMGITYSQNQVEAHLGNPAMGGIHGQDVFGNSFGSFYQGTLDEVRIFDRAISEAEISSLYNLGSPAVTPTPTPSPTPTPTLTPSPGVTVTPTITPDVNTPVRNIRLDVVSGEGSEYVMGDYVPFELSFKSLKDGLDQVVIDIHLSVHSEYTLMPEMDPNTGQIDANGIDAEVNQTPILPSEVDYQLVDVNGNQYFRTTISKPLFDEDDFKMTLFLKLMPVSSVTAYESVDSSFQLKNWVVDTTPFTDYSENQVPVESQGVFHANFQLIDEEILE